MLTLPVANRCYRNTSDSLATRSSGSDWLRNINATTSSSTWVLWLAAGRSRVNQWKRRGRGFDVSSACRLIRRTETWRTGSSWRSTGRRWSADRRRSGRSTSCSATRWGRGGRGRVLRFWSRDSSGLLLRSQQIRWKNWGLLLWNSSASFLFETANQWSRKWAEPKLPAESSPRLLSPFAGKLYKSKIKRAKL